MPKLHRTNINLYEEDVEWLQKTYGYGWTERVREIVRIYISEHGPNEALEDDFNQSEIPNE